VLNKKAVKNFFFLATHRCDVVCRRLLLRRGEL
jgi:hypothetical protein